MPWESEHISPNALPRLRRGIGRQYNKGRVAALDRESVMALPEFNSQGDLPDGLHRAILAEVLDRFGAGSQARRSATALLQDIHRRVTATGKLERFGVFGSYVTAKPDPRDVDVVLVMKDDFSLAACDEPTRILFDHQRAEAEVGASVFWLCPGVLLRGSLEDFLLGWGTKRDLTRRGIVEVVP
jgi:hypothetical protein